MSIFSKLCNNIVDFGTKNSNARTEKIVKITPHHMAGNILAGDCAKMHKNKPYSSANYYIGSDGFIVGGVSEDRRAWTSSSSWNDQRSITIEVANNGGDPTWPISDKAYKSLVNLCADICKRYSITPHWDGTKNGSITLHYQFAATACPGPTLQKYVTTGQFEKDVKAAMGGTPIKPDVSDILYRVQVGAFITVANAEKLLKELKGKGYEGYIVKVGAYNKVQVGAFADKKNAEKMESKLIADGYSPFITTDGAKAVVTDKVAQTNDEYIVGTTYKVQPNAGLNVRVSPSTSASFVVLLKKGTSVKCLESKLVQGDIWVRMNQGWCCARKGSSVYLK